jgi:23S rRNA pseudouridine1911/1915/1917 synthase
MADMTETVQRLTAGADDAGQRIDRLIAATLGELSRSRVKALIEDGRIAINGQTIDNPSFRVKPGQAITVTVPAPVADLPAAQAMPLAIVYEDAHLVVLDKPAGLVVHPAPGNPDATLVNALLAHCGDDLAGIGGVRRPGIVHRLDKDTSGLMVVAKTDLAHGALSADFAARRIERAYWAAVWGVPSLREGRIDQPIGRSPANRKKMGVVAGGRAAVTRYRVVRPLGMLASLLECRLETGRTHQIRVHLTSIGHPLIGDPVYGRPPAAARAAKPAAALNFGRQALHAFLLGFTHPATGDALRFESALPPDLALLLRNMEGV